MSHPYIQFEGTPLWHAVNEAVEKLVINNDIIEATARTHVVGYLCQQITEKPELIIQQLQTNS